MKFAHLHAHSPFSFLDGASSMESMVDRAADLGMEALAITDHDNVSAAIRFRNVALSRGLKPIQGVEATLKGDGPGLPTHLVLLAENPEGYRNICAALTRAHLDNPRRKPALDLEVLRDHAAGVIALSGCRRGEIPSRILRGDYTGALEVARRYLDIFGKQGFFIELSEQLLPGSMMLNERLTELANRLDLNAVATANVHYSRRDDFPVHDLLTCIRTLTTVDGVHPERKLNAENYLRSPEEMTSLFSRYPGALRGAYVIAERCGPALEVEEKCYPSFPVPEGTSPGEMLRDLVRDGARRRYGRITAKIRDRLEHELDIIFKLGYEDYFLIVWDIVNFARRKGIRHSGRGSAADSAVAYCLGITGVDSIARGLLFERFMSLERAQKPDIDIDFDARYRDEVQDYACEKYGAARVASVCTYNTFQARSAIRDLGKAIGFSEAEIDRLAKRMPYIHADSVREALVRFPELRDLNLDPVKFECLISACKKIAGFPRFLGTHLGGIVISRRPLTDLMPLQMAAKGVIVGQFDKDDVEELGLIKLDLLSLRMLSAVEDTMSLINGPGAGSPGAGGGRGCGCGSERSGEWRLDYDSIPTTDRDSYELLRTGQTIGVFQLESPAQRALQSRLGANRFEDLVASVALIRPGPILGNMVEPYIARRKGLEPIGYVDSRLKPILDKTYGVVLFQEQVIQIATIIAGFTPGEADRLRKVMSHHRSQQEMDEIGKVFIARAVENGASTAIAGEIFSYIVGYAGYGFCEAHAAAFATTAAKTAYLSRHYPAEFFAGILTNQPMGYYPPETICVEARNRGVKILGPCVNRSGKAFTVETAGDSRAIRVSLACVRDMTGQALDRIVEARRDRPFISLEDFCSRVNPPRDIVENLALCGAFDVFHPNRRAMLWRAGSTLGTSHSGHPGCAAGDRELRLEWNEAGDYYSIPDLTPAERIYHEYRILGIAVSQHPMALFRNNLKADGFLSSRDVRKARQGAMVKVAGFPVRPHRPPTKSGRIVVFLSLEDEFGLADLTIFENTYQKYGQVIFTDPAPPLKVTGRIQRRGNGVSVVAREIEILTGNHRHESQL
ncbi:MAG: DNA polymerase III subunit alpha [Ignavibacteriales bacterium]